MSDSTEKLSDFLPLSPDHNAERLAALKSLFPDIFTNEGKLNIEEFKKVVDPALVSETERYDFRWYGKTASKREAFTPSRAALVYDKDRSVNPEKARGNMIIEGGKRQFIVVQMPEQTVSNSPATRAGFKKISDITIERAKRVIGRIQKEAEDL
jgi:adenine-specific DNA-methyltransferase